MKNKWKLFLILAVCVVAMAIAVSGFSAHAAQSLQGDMNQDGQVNVDDAVYLLRHTLMAEEYPIAQSGDLDQDSDVDVDDAIYLLRHTLMPNKYPLKCSHVPVVDPAQEADCTTAGLTEGSHCGLCGEILVEQQVVAPLGHSAVLWETKEADCTNDGYVQERCTVCESVYVSQVSFAAGHSFGPEEVIVAATCTAEGLRRQTCTVCDFVKESVIPATGHTFTPEGTNQDGTVSCTCPDCGKTVTADTLEEIYEEGEDSYEFDCDADYSFLVTGPEDEAYIREHLVIIDAFFENTQYEDHEQVVQDYELEYLGDGIWRVSPVEGYEGGNTYLAEVEGDVTFTEHPGNKLYFDVIGQPQADVTLAQNIIFIVLPDAASASREDYEMIAAEDGETFYLLIPQSEGITQEDVGRIVCYGDYASMEEIFADGSKECAFGKIEQVLVAYDGRCMLVLGCPTLEEVYENLDVYQNFTLELTEEDIPEEFAQQAVEALKASDDFSEFVASVLLAAESYAAEHGVYAEGVQDRSVLQNLVLYPTVKVVDQGVKVTITGKLSIPLKTGQGTKYGTITVSLTAEMEMSFDVKAVCQLKYFAFVPHDVRKFDFSVTQRTAYDFNFQVSVKLDSDPDESLKKVYRSPYGMYHLESCKCVKSYTTGYLTACSLEELDRAFRTTLGKTELECPSCSPMTGYLTSTVYVINDNSGIVHRFHCRSEDRMDAEKLTVTNSLPDDHGYSYCSVCASEDFANRDFQQRMIDSLKYEQWGKVVGEVKEMLKSQEDQEDFRKTVLHCPFNVAYVFTVNIDVSLVVDFEFSGSVSYSKHYETTNVYGVRRNAAGSLETYRVSDSESTTSTIKFMGNAQIKMGVRLDVYMSLVGLQRFVRVGIAAEVGVYADMGGILYLSGTKTQEGTTDTSIIDPTNYYAAYTELGLYADVQFSWKLLVWQKDSSLLGSEVRVPLVIFGYDKVYYKYADVQEWVRVSGTTCDLNEMDLLQVYCFNVRSQSNTTELLSILGKEGKYEVRITLLDSDGNEHPHATVRDGRIYIQEGAPCDLEVVVRIEVIGLEDGVNWNDNVWEDKTALHSSCYQIPVYTFTVNFQNHSVSDWVVVEEPTCLETGLEERYSTCDCQETERRVIPALGHQRETIPAVEVTCTTDGRTEGSYCARCQVVFVESVVIPALGHRFTDEFTCHDRPCQNAGCDYVEVATTEHIYSDWIELEPAGCSLVGYSVRYCYDCRYMDIQLPEGVDTLHPHQDLRVDHAYETCTEDGYAILKCYACNVELAHEIYPKTGHDLSAYLYTEDGHYKICQNFGCQYQTELEDHSFESVCDRDCAVCDYTRNTDHKWKDSYAYNTTSHWIECENCDEIKDRGAHTGGTATPDTKAVCQVCGASYGDYGRHDYSQQIVSEKYLMAAADCENAAKYYYSCACCGGVGTEWFTYGAPLGHQWQTTYSADDRSHYYACDRCDARKDEQAHTGTPATCQQRAWCEVCENYYGELRDHQYDQKVVDDRYLASEADCEHAAKYYYSCVCGEKGSGTFTSGDALGHAWAEDYDTDADRHWQVCGRCGECSQAQVHTGGKATCCQLARCEVCGEEYGKLADHTWSETYEYNESAHWLVCTVCEEEGQQQSHSGGEAVCGNRAECQTCGAEYGDEGSHAFVQKNTDAAYRKAEATCTSPAEYYYSCACGTMGSETFFDGQALGHNCGQSYAGDTTHHWKVCDRCGEQLEKADHNFNQKNVTEAYLAEAATCTTATKYYYSCVCGEKGSQTFFEGEALGHDCGEDYIYDDAHHWKLCDRCGEQQEKNEHSGGKATCTAGPVCKDCGCQYGEALGHTPESEYSYDDSKHWIACANCDETLEQGVHTGGEATCQNPALCEICQQAYGERADHAYTAENTADKYLAEAATCTQAAKYYYCCVYCGEKGQQTFSYGDPIAHDWAQTWSSDEENHWYDCKNCDAKDQIGEHVGGMATCTEKAICALCEEAYGDTVPHSYTQEIATETYEVQAPACEVEGIYYYSCVCGEADPKNTFTTPALTHDWAKTYSVSEEAHWFDCTRSGCDGVSGYSEHYGGIATCQRLANCAACMQAYGDYGEHTFTAEIAEQKYLAATADCENAARYYYSCLNCAEKGTETFAYGEPLGHDWADEWTCESAMHYRLCENGCGQRTGEAIHSFGDYIQTKAPTCTEVGTEKRTCGVCDYSEERDVPMIDHTMVSDQTVVKSETIDGMTWHTIQVVDQCSVCGYYVVISEGTVHEHNDYRILDPKQPTCTEPGLTVGAVCNVSGCGQVVLPQEELPALGHDYVDGICTRCGEKEVVASTGLEFTLSDDGTYYIVSGIGTCTDTDIVIPDTYNGLPVQEIGAWAFASCSRVTGVTIPAGVTTIGYNAFYNCSLLRTVTLPYGIATIAEEAFFSCERLAEITIPDSVTTIGNGAFAYCAKLTSVTIPKGVEVIGRRAFAVCDQLTGIWVDANNPYYCSDQNGVLFDKTKETLMQMPCAVSGNYDIPDSVVTIADGAFDGCDGLTNITMTHGVVSIGEHAFSDCVSLTSIIIPSSVTTISQGAFWYCTSLTDITFEGDAPAIASNIFYGTTTTAYYPAGNATWTDSVRQNYSGTITWVAYTKASEGLEYTLSDDSTYYIVSGIGTCTDTDLIIPDTYNGLPVKEIGKSAFSRCVGLESVVIPDSVQVIGESAFSNCTALKNVHIGTGLKTLGGYAFNECTALEQLRIDAVAIDDFTGESWTFYNAGKNSGGFTVTFGASVTKVPAYLFYQYYNYSSSTYYVYLTNVVFEADSACKTIGTATFRYCMGLTQITLPAGLQYIENNAFDNCWNLVNVDMGNEVLAIGDMAFGSCGFSTITLSSKLKTIGEYAFTSCDKLTQIVIPDSVESIGASAFYECGALKEITIGKGVVTMGDNALWYCRTLETIYFNATAMEDMEDGSSMVYYAGIEGNGVQLIIGANVQRIPAYFCNDDGRSKLVTVTFASGSACLTIGDYAFAYCDELVSVTLGESLTYIGPAAFLWCESLTSILIPDTVTTIAGEAFCCAGLESVTLGTGLEVIDFCAFTYCESLTSITIPANVSYIGAFAFEGCSALRQITFLGNAPEIGDGAFNSVTATVYYPQNNSTWTVSVRQNYGGTLTWKAK